MDPAIQSIVLSWGPAGVFAVLLYLERNRLLAQITTLEGKLDAERAARLAELKEMNKDVTGALKDANRVMETVSQENGRQVELVRTVIQVVTALKEGVERWMARP